MLQEIPTGAAGGRGRRVGAACIVRLMLVLGLAAVTVPPAWAEDPPAGKDPEAAARGWLELGVDEPFIDFERNLIKDQIRTFIPPLLRGSTPQHAFTLPPRTWEIGLTTRFAEISGDDVFKNGKPNLGTFADSNVERFFLDLGIFYGFDFKRKYLHSFTAFLNIPYQASTVNGFIHPNGVQALDILNNGATQEIGDISLFIKKKIVDQANFPIGVAIMGGVYLPTGANDERFGLDGLVMMRGPMMPGGEAPPVGMPLPIDLIMQLPRGVGPFPYNDGIFDRFSSDGRLPSSLQAGDGTTSWVVGGFLTRQFLPGDLPLFSRAALHIGSTQRFRGTSDGIHRGDVNTHQLSFVFPVFKDYLGLEIGYLGFYQSGDRYDGDFITAFYTDAMGNQVDGGDATHVTFKSVERGPSTQGEWGNLMTSLVYSPDPQIRFVATLLTRVVDPDLGPAPGAVFKFTGQVLF